MESPIVHFEIPAADVERAKTFWGGVMGWRFGESAMPEFPYFMVDGGAVYPDEERAGRGITIYYGTDDIDAAIGRVREHGGEADDKQPIPQIGWFAHCRDTEGNPFSLFQPDESAAG